MFCYRHISDGTVVQTTREVRVCMFNYSVYALDMVTNNPKT